MKKMTALSCAALALAAAARAESFCHLPGLAQAKFGYYSSFANVCDGDVLASPNRQRALGVLIGNSARVKLFEDVKMHELRVRPGVELDLNGWWFTACGANIGGVKIPPGKYSAAKLAGMGVTAATDTSPGPGGLLEIRSNGTILFLR